MTQCGFTQCMKAMKLSYCDKLIINILALDFECFSDNAIAVGKQ